MLHIEMQQRNERTTKKCQVNIPAVVFMKRDFNFE